MQKRREYQPFFRVEMLAMTLGRLPIPFVTITENINTYLEYTEELRIYNDLPTHLRKAIKSLYRSIYQLTYEYKHYRYESAKNIQKLVQHQVD